MTAHAVIETARYAADDELLDPWFHLDDSPLPAYDDVYERDPVRPFWRLAIERLFFWK